MPYNGGKHGVAVAAHDSGVDGTVSKVGADCFRKPSWVMLSVQSVRTHIHWMSGNICRFSFKNFYIFYNVYRG